MRTIEPVEYLLHLSTGEDITVAELDPESVPSLTDPIVVHLADAVLSRCTKAPRAAIEDAKNGLPESLEPFLRTPPAGCLLAMASPICAEIRQCAISDPAKCTTRRRTKRGGPDFPMCWTFSVPEGGTEQQRSEARGLADTVVDAWRWGRHVLIADG